VFNAREDLKLFLKACEEQKKSNESYRINVYKSLDESFKKLKE
jgi:hypothetical protein